jgi:hypothetical protein
LTDCARWWICGSNWIGRVGGVLGGSVDRLFSMGERRLTVLGEYELWTGESTDCFRWYN